MHAVPRCVSHAGICSALRPRSSKVRCVSHHRAPKCDRGAAPIGSRYLITILSPSGTADGIEQVVPIASAGGHTAGERIIASLAGRNLQPHAQVAVVAADARVRLARPEAGLRVLRPAGRRATGSGQRRIAERAARLPEGPQLSEGCPGVAVGLPAPPELTVSSRGPGRERTGRPPRVRWAFQRRTRGFGLAGNPVK